MRVKQLILAFVVGVMTCALFVAGSIHAAPTNVIDIVGKMPDDIVRGFDTETEAAVYGLWRAQQIIQAELDARGSSMNSGQVIVSRVRKALEYSKKLKARSELVGNAGYAESDPLITSLDADIEANAP